MSNFHNQSDPGRNTQFRRRWAQLIPLSPAQIELGRLRAELGNAAGQREFQKRVARGQVRI